ncbi:MAG: methyl-accepting chemotaxis protein [Nitrospirota bacterium]
MKLLDWTISKKLYLSLGIIALIVVIVEGFSIFVVKKVNEFRDDIKNYKSIHNEIKITKDIQLKVANVWQFITDASLTKDKEVLTAEAKPDLDAAYKDIDRLIELNKNKSEEIKKLETLKNDLSKVWEIGNKMFNAYGSDWEKGNTVMDEYDKVCDIVIQEASGLVDNKDKEGEEAVEEMFQMVGSSVKTTTIIALLIGIGGVLFAFFMFILKNSITKPLNEAVVITNKVAEGDLTVNLETRSKDEIGQVCMAVKTMTEKLKKVVGDLKSASDSMASASQQLRASSEQMTRSVTEQSGRASQIATSSNEMSQTVVDIAKNASNIASSASGTSAIAKDGEGIVNKSIEEVKAISDTVHESAKLMASLGERSRQIGDIVNVIKDIADQTNLLALNAAIEAARAGEQGRGFAVVADEVRKLAERTAKATSEIGEMIGAIQDEVEMAVTSMEKGTKRVEVGVEFSSQASDALRKIVDSVNELQSMVQQIASSTEEMSTVSEQISGDIETIANVSKETSTSSEQVAQSSSDLARLATNLQGLVGLFKV